MPAAGHRAAPWRGLTCARGRGLRCQSCLCPASVPQSRVRCAVCAPAAAAAHGSRWCRAAGWARASGGGAWEREGGAARVLRGAPPRCCCSGSLRDASVLLLLLRARVPCQAWSHATGAWAAVAPLPVPRACAAAVCSGERRRHPLRALVRAPLLVCAHRPPLRCAGGHVYVIGGTGAEGTAVAAVHAYDAATDSWTSVASLPTPRSGHAAATLPGACARARSCCRVVCSLGVSRGVVWCGPQTSASLWRAVTTRAASGRSRCTCFTRTETSGPGSPTCRSRCRRGPLGRGACVCTCVTCPRVRLLCLWL